MSTPDTHLTERGVMSRASKRDGKPVKVADCADLVDHEPIGVDVGDE